MAVAVILAIIFIITAILWFMGGRILKEQNRKRDYFISELKRLPHKKMFVNDKGTKALLLNSDKNEIILAKPDDNFEKINYKDILQTEIIENGNSISHVQRKSQIGGALLGGLLAGGVGAIIGGLSSKQRHLKEVNELGLRLVINDTSSPIREVLFYDNQDIPLNQSTNQYRDIQNELYDWFKTIEVLIHQADKDDELKAQ